MIQRTAHSKSPILHHHQQTVSEDFSGKQKWKILQYSQCNYGQLTKTQLEIKEPCTNKHTTKPSVKEWFHPHVSTFLPKKTNSHMNSGQQNVHQQENDPCLYRSKCERSVLTSSVSWSCSEPGRPSAATAPGRRPARNDSLGPSVGTASTKQIIPCTDGWLVGWLSACCLLDI